MAKHVLYDREDELDHCKVCGGAEGTLPTECPGERMTEQQELDVWDSVIDFKDGKWVTRG